MKLPEEKKWYTDDFNANNILSRLHVINRALDELSPKNDNVILLRHSNIELEERFVKFHISSKKSARSFQDTCKIPEDNKFP